MLHSWQPFTKSLSSFSLIEGSLCAMTNCMWHQIAFNFISSIFFPELNSFRRLGFVPRSTRLLRSSPILREGLTKYYHFYFIFFNKQGFTAIFKQANVFSGRIIFFTERSTRSLLKCFYLKMKTELRGFFKFLKSVALKVKQIKI